MRIMAGGKGDDAREPAVSLHSFLWAHCLVSSRALELMVQHERDTGPGESAVQLERADHSRTATVARGVRRVQCMVPGESTSSPAPS